MKINNKLKKNPNKCKEKGTLSYTGHSTHPTQSKSTIVKYTNYKFENDKSKRIWEQKVISFTEFN